jgi:signal peptidase I
MNKRNKKAAESKAPAVPPKTSRKPGSLIQRASKFLLSDWGMYLLPLAFIAVYILAEQLPYSSIFGLLTFLSIVYIVVVDVAPSKAESKSPEAPLMDFVKTIALAIAAWILICILLGTAKPLDVVTSCSMLPVLHRGDLVFLQGGQVSTQNVTLGSSITSSDLRFSDCSINYFNGTTARTSCLESLVINNVTYPARTSNDIIIYEPDPSVYGSIIHRAMLKVNYGNESYILTKGDNNPGMDQQSGIQPVTAAEVDGKVIFDVPAIGYLKVFLFAGFDFLGRLPTLDLGYAMSAFDAPDGCNYVISAS